MGHDSVVELLDIRSGAPVSKLQKANNIQVRSLDFNPIRSGYVAVGGDDCCVRVFDLRKPDKALLEFHEHNHWVWSVAFNPYHDQLLLSGGSDDLVILYNAESIYSDRILSSPLHRQLSATSNNAENSMSNANNNVNNAPPAPPPRKAHEQLSDGILSLFEQHEESVYRVCWSVGDPWVFASVSFDGRVVLNNVPDDIKYQIIL